MDSCLKLKWIYFPPFVLRWFVYPRERATGKMELNVKLFGTNPRLFEQNGKLFLIFNSGVKLYGCLHDWNILTGDADGCTVKLFGRNPIIGNCTIVTGMIKKELDKKLNTWITVDAPEMI